MTAFIIVCAAMLVAAVAALAYPLLRPLPAAVKGQPALPSALVPAAVIGIALAIGAVAMYRHASNFPWQDPRIAAAVPPGHGEEGAGASMDEVTRQLEARLKEHPEDAAGWRMMARTYLVTNRPKDAVAAYERAIAVVGTGDAGLQIDLAEALILSDDPAVLDRAGGIVAATLAADATNQKALWYSGVMAYRANDVATAKARWSALLEQNPPPEIRQILEQQLATLGVAVPAAAAGPGPQGGMAAGGAGPADAAPQGRTIRVSVAVDPALRARLKPGTVVFVAAREPGIPGPPLAARRLSSDELPATVVLSDANAMVEGRNLSSVNDVEVVARVAFGGTPVVASGDLLGTAIQKKGGAEELAVTIAKIQP